MPIGKIKFCKPEKQFGFIEHPDYPDGLHFSFRECHDWIPSRGDACEFNVGKGPDGRPTAKRVRNSDSRPNSSNPGTGIANQHCLAENIYPNPYNFIPVEPDLALTDQPVWHDGQDSGERFTGRLSIALLTLTPLIVGNEHYCAQDALDDIRIGNATVPGQKKIIEPLRLPDGRVALSGGSLNGMVRHSLGALLSAPMERVAEQLYSYRPNINGLRPNPDTCFEARPAVIEGWEGENLKIKVLPDLQCVYFSEADFEKDYDAGPSLYPLGCCFDIPNAKKASYERNKIEKRYIKKHDQPLKGWYLFSYVGGIDACGELNKLFRKNPQARVHRFAAVSGQSFAAAEPNKITDDCIKHYLASLKQLGNDKTGHLADHPLLDAQSKDKKQAIQNNLKVQIERWKNKSSDLLNQLIFVEIDKHNGKITSFGHNFLYRWRYADSVRLQNNGEVRDILKPHKDEQVAENSPESTAPKQLSGARLLFGYVSARSDKPWLSEGSDNIGKGRYQRLKGRISCNFAVEYWTNGAKPDDEQRFLPGVDNKQFFIPLKPLGKPRSSAVEKYLYQTQDSRALNQARNGDRAGLRTYGDLPGIDTPGELAGRKFYPHQPDAASDEACYTVQDREYIAGKSANQASLARFVSRPGTGFRFMLHCNDLRPWEMGALLVTLEPCKYLPALVSELTNKESAQFNPVKQKLEALLNKAAQKQLAAFGHKLGLARPLGLGSVLLHIDKAEQLVDKCGLPTLNTLTETEHYITAFADKLLTKANPEALAKHLERWAAIHRYAGLTRAKYPVAATKENGQTVERIFAHHSKIRREHMNNRRLQQLGSSNKADGGALQPELLPESGK